VLHGELEQRVLGDRGRGAAVALVLHVVGVQVVVRQGLRLLLLLLQDLLLLVHLAVGQGGGLLAGIGLSGGVQVALLLEESLLLTLLLLLVLGGHLLLLQSVLQLLLLLLLLRLVVLQVVVQIRLLHLLILAGSADLHAVLVALGVRLAGFQALQRHIQGLGGGPSS